MKLAVSHAASGQQHKSKKE